MVLFLCCKPQERHHQGLLFGPQAPAQAQAQTQAQAQAQQQKHEHVFGFPVRLSLPKI